jgi:hypothetical protein
MMTDLLKCRENTGNFADSGLAGTSEAAKKRTKSVSYGPIPYAGNFLRPCRELNRAIREVSAEIRESRFRPLFGHSLLVTNPIVPRSCPSAWCRRGRPRSPAGFWPVYVRRPRRAA